MSDWTPLARGAEHDPDEVAAREARHGILIDLLGAYVDRELPPETAAQVEAHLVGCTRCRRELAVQQAMRERLAAEPSVGASSALRDRIAAAVAVTPLPAPPPRRPRLAPRTLAIAASALLLLALAAIFVWRAAGDAPAVVRVEQASSVPLLAEVLADYRRVTAGDLPGRARDLAAVRAAVPFEVEPLQAPELRLVAAWTATIDGEPSAVLAYRAGDRVLLQYLVPEAHLFRSPAMRAAIGGGHVVTAQDGAQGLAAWPLPSAGSILVGDLPAAQLARLVAVPTPLAPRVTRGAE